MKAGFHELDPWWGLVQDDTERQKQLKQDQQEVWDEMISQELETRNPHTVASEWGMHVTTAYRRARRVR